jgi:hypothetical protein
MKIYIEDKEKVLIGAVLGLGCFAAAFFGFLIGFFANDLQTFNFITGFSWILFFLFFYLINFLVDRLFEKSPNNLISEQSSDASNS